MTAPLKVAIFGDPRTCKILREAAAAQESCEILDTAALEICDEWQTRRWFVDRCPNLVLIGILGQPEATSRELLLNTQGLINVLSASVGVTDRVRISSWFASNSYYLIRRLGQLLAEEKGVNIISKIVVGNAAIAKACVLDIHDVSAQEKDAESSEGDFALHEVCDQVVPQPKGAQFERVLSKTLLEVPVQAVERETSRDLRAQRDPSARQG